MNYILKKLLPAFIILLLLVSCNGGKDEGPDVSGIKVDVNIERFEKDLFAIDTNNIPSSLQSLQQKYPDLATIYVQNILGLSPESATEGLKAFIRLSGNLYDTVNAVFKNTNSIESELEKAFRYVKYYFPDYKIPKVYTLVGPVDALAQSATGLTPNFLGPGFLGISLQFYLGPAFSVYQDQRYIEQVVPLYRSRRFTKEYVVPEAMQLVVDDLFPDQSGGRSLVEQMIERGKQWWLLKKFLPSYHDSLITGYRGDQVDWIKNNEGLVWTYISKNEDLRSISPVVIQTYIGEAPFTQGLSQEQSPGNIGQWFGWQIVEKYASKNPGLNISEVMKASPDAILEGAKYKPK